MSVVGPSFGVSWSRHVVTLFLSRKRRAVVFFVEYIDDVVNQCTSERFGLELQIFLLSSRIFAPTRRLRESTIDMDRSRSDWRRMDLRSQPRHGGSRDRDVSNTEMTLNSHFRGLGEECPDDLIRQR